MEKSWKKWCKLVDEILEYDCNTDTIDKIKQFFKKGGKLLDELIEYRILDPDSIYVKIANFARAIIYSFDDKESNEAITDFLDDPDITWNMIIQISYVWDFFDLDLRRCIKKHHIIKQKLEGLTSIDTYICIITNYHTSKLPQHFLEHYQYIDDPNGKLQSHLKKQGFTDDYNKYVPLYTRSIKWRKPNYHPDRDGDDLYKFNKLYNRYKVMYNWSD